MSSGEDQAPSLKVILFLAAGLVAFAFAPIFVKMAGKVDAVTLSMYRTVFAVLILAPFWIYRKVTHPSKPVSKTIWKWKIGAGIFLGLHFIFWISSLSYTSVASASVLVTIHPILLIIVESLGFKRRFRSTTWVGVFVAFLGSSWLAWIDSGSDRLYENAIIGDILAVTAAVFFMIYFLIGQKIRQHSGWLEYVFPLYGFAALTCIITVVLISAPLVLPIKALILALAMAVGPQILGHGSMNYAVKTISPTLLSTLILAEPLFSTGLAFLIFGELPLALSFVAMIVTMLGVGLTWIKTKKKTV